MRFALVFGVMTVAVVGCKSEAESTSDNGTIGPAPRELAIQLIELHATRNYTKMEKYIRADRARSLTATLVAIDSFLAAEADLRAYIRDHVDFGAAEVLDLSYFASALGLFSKNVELLDENIRADAAEVQFVVDGNLPAQAAEFVRVDRRWRYDPGPGFDPALPRAFHEMANGARKFLDDIKSDRVPDARLRVPEQLAREYQQRIAAGLKLLPRSNSDEK